MSRQGRGWAIVASAVVIVAVVVAIVVASTGRQHLTNAHGTADHPASSGPASTGPASTGGSTAVTASTAAGPPSVPVVACPTTYGVTPPPSKPTVPTSIVAPDLVGLTSQLAFYTNRSRTMAPLLGPRGWTCQVQVGADGTVGFTIHPESSPATSAATSGQPLVQAFSDGGCQGCVISTVCPYYAGLGQLLGYSPGSFPCSGLPSGETVDWVKGSAMSSKPPVDDVINFAEPSAPDPTAGAVLFIYPGPGSAARASQVFCSLQPAQSRLCTAIVGSFVSAGWLL